MRYAIRQAISSNQGIQGDSSAVAMRTSRKVRGEAIMGNQRSSEVIMSFSRLTSRKVRGEAPGWRLYCSMIWRKVTCR